MDEILCANFMVFDDLVREQRFDVWIGDEAWEVDHFLHENPELKTAPYAWLTDFVGFLPMPAGGEREAFLTADYNAEMIEHIERYPQRSRPRDLRRRARRHRPRDASARACPRSATGRERHYSFAGYIPGFDPGPPRQTWPSLARRARRTATSRCASISVGGSGVGAPLLHRVIEALPLARERVPDLRVLAVAGPRIDPASLPARRRARGASATCTSSTGTWPPATWPSCRAG